MGLSRPVELHNTKNELYHTQIEKNHLGGSGDSGTKCRMWQQNLTILQTYGIASMEGVGKGCWPKYFGNE